MKKIPEYIYLSDNSLSRAYRELPTRFKIVLTMQVREQLLMLLPILKLCAEYSMINLMVMMRLTSCTWMDHFHFCRGKRAVQPDLFEVSIVS